MKNIIRGLASVTLVAAAFLSMNASAVSAAPAQTGQGTGCQVSDATGAYHFDAGCQAFLVTRFDAAGNLVLYEYQDAGQVPAGAPLPKSTIRSEYEQCLNVGLPDPICGTTQEIVTPSGAYKSYFKYHG